MDKKAAIIMSLLGAGPITAIPIQASAQEQAAYSVHERTSLIVQKLIESNALYANADATNLLIRKSALNADMIQGLEASSEVVVDPASQDFVVLPELAVALLKARTFDSVLPKTIEDFVMIQRLRVQASGTDSMELASFNTTPFF